MKFSLGGERLRWYATERYALEYLIMNSCSSEHSLIADHLRERGHLSGAISGALDVGGADGDLTERLFSAVSKITVIEPNPILFQLLSGRCRSDDRIIAVNSRFFENEIDFEKYNLINFAHIFYHIDCEEQKRWLDAIFNKSKFDGKVFVSLWSNKSAAFALSRRHREKDWLYNIELFEQHVLSDRRFSDLEILDRIETRPVIKCENDISANYVANFFMGADGGDLLGLNGRQEVIGKLIGAGLETLNYDPRADS